MLPSLLFHIYINYYSNQKNFLKILLNLNRYLPFEHMIDNILRFVILVDLHHIRSTKVHISSSGLSTFFFGTAHSCRSSC